MAVGRNEYRMWAKLAQREDLPAEAFEAVVTGLLPESGRLEESWQDEVFAKTLPALLRRVGDQELRDRLIAGVRTGMPQLVRLGLVGGRDVPAVLRHHRADAELLAALARDENHREVVEEVVEHADPDMLPVVLLAAQGVEVDDDGSAYTYEIPSWLIDAVLRRHLVVANAALDDFPDRTAGITVAALALGLDEWPSLGSLAMVLERCPERWLALVGDETFGMAVQHTLLDFVATEKIADEVLAGCTAALILPEMAELARPTKTQRIRLRRIGQRVAKHPRLQELARGELADAAAWCVSRGRLLHASQLKQERFYDITVVGLAKDLAATSGNGKELAKLLGLVMGLPQPAAVERSSTYDTDYNNGVPSPKQVLSDDRRVSALAALAGNPLLDRGLVLDCLDRLHGMEVRWLATYEKETPLWLVEAASRHTPTAAQAREVPRVMTDEELDGVDDPEAVLQGWLDAVKDHQLGFFHSVQFAVLSSRHCSDALIRQLDACNVLCHHDTPAASDALIRLCGTDPDRWDALARALAEPIELKGRFGEFLDRVAAASPLDGDAREGSSPPR
jgi:hypothetical protein